MKKSILNRWIVLMLLVLISGCVPTNIVDLSDIPSTTPLPPGLYTGTITYKEKITYSDSGEMNEYQGEIPFSWVIDSDGFPLYENNRLIPGSIIKSDAGNASISAKVISVSVTDKAYLYTTKATMIQYSLDNKIKYTFTGNGEVYLKLLEDGRLEFHSQLNLLDSTGKTSDEFEYLGILSK